MSGETKIHRCDTEVALRSFEEYSTRQEPARAFAAGVKIGREIFLWGEQNSFHRRGHLLPCAVRYRLGLPQLLGIIDAFPEIEPWYVDSNPRGIREVRLEGGALAPGNCFGGHPQLPIVDPFVADGKAVERLLRAVTCVGTIGQPVFLNIAAGARLGFADAELGYFGNVAILEKVDETKVACAPPLSPGEADGFGVRAFGPWGPAYPKEAEVAGLQSIMHTGMGLVEALRGEVFVAALSWEMMPRARRVPCNWRWISAVLSLVHAKTRAPLPIAPSLTPGGSYWLPPLSPIGEELDLGGFMREQGGDLLVTGQGREYYREVLLPALKPTHEALLAAVAESVGEEGLARLRPDHINPKIARAKDPRFPGLLS